MPVVQEVGGLRAAIGAMIADRRTWPAIPAVLLATLLLALGLSGSWGQTPITAVGSPTPTERSSATPRATTAGTPATAAPSAAPPTAAPSATPETTPRPTPAPTAAPTYTTYRVQSGDTLSGIATRFHTTVKAISALNGISSTTTLHIGQILKVPKS
jgi:LysM repeat protein